MDDAVVDIASNSTNKNRNIAKKRSRFDHLPKEIGNYV